MRTNNLMKFNWMFWHRWLGILTCVGILLWAVSGISHPIMSRLQPMPAAFKAPQQQFDLAQAVPVKAVLDQHAIKVVQRINLASIANQQYYRITIDAAEPARYFAVDTGQELQDADAVFAKHLAAHFTGRDESEVVTAELVTAFGGDYHAVNRLLPVWRVTFSGEAHLRAFIDTEQSRLATLVDDTRHFLTQVFQFGHNWSFLNGLPTTQLLLASLVLFAIFASAISGIWMYFRFGRAKSRLAKQSLRLWHRRLGLLVALSALIFSSSGFFHLIMSDQQQKLAIPHVAESVLSNSLNDGAWNAITSTPLARLNLISHGGEAYWYGLPAAGKNQMPQAQVAALAKKPSQHDHHAHSAPAAPNPSLIGAKDGQASTAEIFAKQKAASLAGVELSKVESTQWITQFKDEYGFIFKRLPVIKVQMQDAEHTRYYIEPSTGMLSVKVRNIDGLEGFVFAYLHKWSFKFLGKNLRDILVSLFALANIIVALMGFTLFYKRYAKAV